MRRRVSCDALHHLRRWRRDHEVVANPLRVRVPRIRLVETELDAAFLGGLNGLLLQVREILREARENREERENRNVSIVKSMAWNEGRALPMKERPEER